MKYKKLLIVFAVLIIAAGIVYLLIDSKLEKKDSTPVPLADKIGTPDKETQLVSRDADTMVSISYSSEGETHVFKKVDGEWIYDGIDGYPLHQAYVNNMANAAADIRYTRMFSDPSEIENTADFSDPLCEIRIQYNDGTEDSYTLGALNDVTQSVYFKKNPDETVYMIKKERIDPFLKSIYFLTDPVDFKKVDSESISSLAIDRKSGGLTVAKLPEGSHEFYSDTIKWKLQSGGKSLPGDGTNAVLFSNVLQSVVLRDCVGYTGFSSCDISDFGLDVPDVYTVSGQTGDDVFSLLVGNKSESGTYYVMVKGTGFIYTTTQTFASALDSVTMQYFIPPSVCSIKLDELEKMTVKYSGEEHVFLAEKNASDGSVKYYVDGKEVPQTPVQNFIIQLDSMTAAGFVDVGDPESDSPYLEIEFMRDTESFKVMTIRFLPYDINYYLVEFNDMNNILVTKRDVESLIGVFKVLLGI